MRSQCLFLRYDDTYFGAIQKLRSAHSSIFTIPASPCSNPNALLFCYLPFQHWSGRLVTRLDFSMGKKQMLNQELSKSNLTYSKVKTWNEILFRNRRRIYKSSILPGSLVVEVVVVVVVIVVVLFFCNTPTSRMMRLLYSTSQVQVDVYA